MKKFSLTFFTISLFATLFTACREEIVVEYDFKETPVIYCLLNQSDSIHYVKINRGFIGPGNALSFAQIADSNYFENVEATVEEVIGSTVTRTWVLDDTLLNNKDTNGVFFAPEQKVYYFSTIGAQPLNQEAIYRLKVDINDGKVKVTGETRLIKDLAVSSSLNQQNAQLKFAREEGEFLNSSITYSAGTAAFSNTTLEITISEHRGSDVTYITIPWNLGEKEPSSGFFESPTFGQAFYDIIAKNVTNDPSITRRQFEKLSAVLTGGSIDLQNYILVNKPSSSLSQTKATYTNLKVTDGYKVIGLFSARHAKRIDKPFYIGNNANIRCIDQNSTRELCQGSITGHLLFCSQHPGDIGGSNPKEYRCQ